MFARFDENPAMTLRVIKETKRYGRTDGRTDARTDGRTDGQRENSIPPTNKVCGGYKEPSHRAPKTSVKTDGLENIYSFTLNNFVYLNLWYVYISGRSS